MGLADWFSTFCKNLQITKHDVISTRYKQITKRLNIDFRSLDSETSYSLYVGSYGRNTAIKSISDLDMLVWLPESVYRQYENYTGNGQSALLQAVRNSIAKTYSDSKIGADGQVINIPFTDGLTFEVVPGFELTDGSFRFPNSNDGGSWKTTNPRAEIKAIQSRNTSCNGNLYELCRLARAWNSERNVAMGGLLVDTLAYQFIDSWAYKDKSYLYYDYMTRDFLKFLSELDSEQKWWKAPGSGQYVFGGGFQYKAKVCYNLSIEAINHNTNGNEWSAKQKWREIFGSAFPS